MRLSLEQRCIIVSTLRKHFGAQSRILLFGSRVDDSARGGDIDLYIEPDLTEPEKLVAAKINAMAELHGLLGEQKIDLVINRHRMATLPIHRLAQQTGISL